MRALQWVREAFLGNVAYKMFAFFLAVLTWGWVQSEQVVEERARARIVWKFPDGLVPVEDPIDDVAIMVQGVQTWVRAARRQDLSLTIDVSGAQEGPLQLDLSDRPIVGLPSQVRVLNVLPARLDIELDRLLRRTVTLAPVTRGELAPGFKLGKIRVEPDRIELSGPARALRGLAEVSTQPVDLAGLREDASFEVGLALPRGQVTTSRTVQTTVHVQVVAITGERALAGVRVAGADPSWTLTPATLDLTLAGPVAELDDLDPAGFEVRVHVPDGWTGPGPATFDAAEGPSLSLPTSPRIRVSSVSPSSITLEKRP